MVIRISVPFSRVVVTGRAWYISCKAKHVDRILNLLTRAQIFSTQLPNLFAHADLKTRAPMRASKAPGTKRESVATTTTGSAACRTSCAQRTAPWDVKCTWKGKCDACPECLGASSSYAYAVSVEGGAIILRSRAVSCETHCSISNFPNIMRSFLCLKISPL